MFLTLAQVAGMPLSILSAGVSARYLGPAALGYMYLGTTMNSLGNLAVDWGQSGGLPQMVARDRSRAGVLLGSSLVWRAASSVVVLGVLILTSRLLGYQQDFLPVLALVALGYFLSTIAQAAQQIIAGFERLDVSAYKQIIEQMAALLFTVPILVLGGNLNAMLVGSAAAVFVAMAYAWRSLRLVGVVKLSFDFEVLKTLLARSTPFAFTSVVLVLQPYIDAVFLSKLASAEVVGWHAASRKLIGVLVFPASAMIGALYPTLCRLHDTNHREFLNACNGALRGTSLMALPISLGCLLYPDLGIAIFSQEGFGHAEANLRVMSLFLFLVYFSMPLGISILASGKQRGWATVQSLCVAVSLVVDPLLIPLAQARWGNGGIGVCVAAVVSEVVVVACGAWMIPKGTFDARFWRAALSALLGGAAMAGVAFLLRSWSSFLAAPLAVLAYALAVWGSGGLDEGFVSAIKRIVGSKLRRAG